MKKRVVLMLLLSSISAIAMDNYETWYTSHKPQVDARAAIKKALQDKNSTAIQEACNTFTKSRRHLVPVEPNDELLLIAQHTVEDAKKALSWLQNRNRCSQLIAGCCAFMLGFCKMNYDLVGFVSPAIEPESNALNVTVDVSTWVSGTYLMKRAFENSDSINAYNNAVLMQNLVEATLRISSGQTENDE
ncbi:MAG: hypothetical protein WCE21_00300 [Candidatus Babeliales bacterium]